MTAIRRLALVVLASVAVVCLFADLIAPNSYETQFRDIPNAPPSTRFLLGTDDLGRDRFSRLLAGSRISLTLAPAAALVATLGAALIGGACGLLGGPWERLGMGVADLFLSLPWLFLLLTVRALLPLDTPPFWSVLATFALLGGLGWAASARVVRASVRSLATSDHVVQARACGIGRWRLLVVHILPNLKPVLLAQFWVSVPVFVLAEANLGLLGLGVSEPLPSWGNLLRELERFHLISSRPWMLAPAALLAVVVSAFQAVLSREEVPS